MHRDVKIGIAVGLVVIVLAVVYFVFPRETPEETASVPASATSNQVVQRPALPRPAVSSLTPEVIVPTVNVPATDPLVVRPVAPTPGVAPAVNVPTVATSTPPAPAASPVVVNVPSVRAPQPTPVIVPSAPAAPREYIVKAGDAGFWAVAQSEYGNGKYWTLVAEANPGIDSNALRVGQKLKVPPLPRQEAPRTATVSPSSATGATRSGGSGTYTVKTGDAGFWGIAQSQYGDGRLWTLIAEANPGIDSSRLRAGQQLVLPPKPASPARAVSAAAPSRTPSDSGAVSTTGRPHRPVFD